MSLVLTYIRKESVVHSKISSTRRTCIYFGNAGTTGGSPKRIRYPKRGKLYYFSYQPQSTKAIIDITSRSPPKYPQEVLKEFNKNENFVSLTKDTKFIDYQNAQIILIGAREGRDVIKSEIGIEIVKKESPQPADIFNKPNKDR